MEVIIFNNEKSIDFRFAKENEELVFPVISSNRQQATNKQPTFYTYYKKSLQNFNFLKRHKIMTEIQKEFNVVTGGIINTQV
ncbi:MAG: hypothetical protein V1872_00050 [bacterium]